jgi:hypothetical protein
MLDMLSKLWPGKKTLVLAGVLLAAVAIESFGIYDVPDKVFTALLGLLAAALRIGVHAEQKGDSE